MIATSVTSLINRDSLVQKLYTDLCQGKIPAIVIPNFLDSAKCQKIANRVLSSKTSSGCGLTEKIGESINSYVSNKLELRLIYSGKTFVILSFSLDILSVTS